MTLSADNGDRLEPPARAKDSDYGCPQDDAEELLWRIFGESPKAIEP